MAGRRDKNRTYPLRKKRDAGTKDSVTLIRRSLRQSQMMATSDEVGRPENPRIPPDCLRRHVTIEKSKPHQRQNADGASPLPKNGARGQEQPGRKQAPRPLPVPERRRSRSVRRRRATRVSSRALAAALRSARPAFSCVVRDSEAVMVAERTSVRCLTLASDLALRTPLRAVPTVASRVVSPSTSDGGRPRGAVHRTGAPPAPDLLGGEGQERGEQPQQRVQRVAQGGQRRTPARRRRPRRRHGP